MAKEAWDRFTSALAECGVGTKLDAAAMEVLANSYATWMNAAHHVRTTGPVWIKAGESGFPSVAWNPFYSVQKKEEKTIKAMLDEFGMTPSSRSGIMVDAEKGIDPFEAFLSKKA